MYLLKFVQYDREIEVGLFEAEEEIFEFLGKIPYYSKTVDIIDEEQYDSHSLKLEEIPEYDEIVYNNYRFILTKFMFNEDDRIDVDWVRLQNFSVKSDSQEPVYSEGSTRVDAYIVPNDEAKTYIEDREELARQLISKFSEKGMKTERCFRNSEDGEAICSYDENGNINNMVYLDPSAINGMKKGKIEEIISGEYNYDWSEESE
ncbi:hypothetical protein [Microaceticoccus formicicus]|uniref:hypothetical protein n=1 Tax=Microaceticoccus formicicus TaxID=3118105 RepID=UPI003CD04DD9|nr:hypothetical protein VZL98_02900 [Peptoniphilaceae bacterium AMB_02]